MRLGEVIAATAGVELVAVMAYEAQIAGIRDANPGSRLLDPVRALVKRGSRSRPGAGRTWSTRSTEPGSRSQS